MAGLLPQPPLQTYIFTLMICCKIFDTHDMLQDSKYLHHDHVLALMGLAYYFFLTEVKSLIKVVKPGSQGYLKNLVKWEIIRKISNQP